MSTGVFRRRSAPPAPRRRRRRVWRQPAGIGGAPPTIRWFSTTGAGAANGLTWDDRAPLMVGANWNPILTAWNYIDPGDGSAGLECRIGPGTYTVGQTVNAALFTATDPTPRFPLYLVGCDASGNRLLPPATNWQSAEPPWDESALPVLVSNAVSRFAFTAGLIGRCLKLQSAQNGTMEIGSSIWDWCSFELNAAVAATGAQVTSAGAVFRNCLLRSSGAAYTCLMSAAGNLFNCRLWETGSPSAGARVAIHRSAALSVGTSAIGCTIVGCTGGGFVSTSTSVSQRIVFFNNTIVGCGSHGIQLSSTVSNVISQIERNYIANNNGWGIDINGSLAFVTNNRMRNNAAGQFNGGGSNYPDFSSYTAAGTDADEFVDAGAGDYRIRHGSAIHGRRYGAAEALSD